MKKICLLLIGLLLFSGVTSMGYVVLYPGVEFYNGDMTVSFSNSDGINVSYIEVGDQYVVLEDLNLSLVCTGSIEVNFSQANSSVNLSSGTSVLRFNTTFSGSSVTFTFTGNHSAAIYNLYIDNSFISQHVAESFSWTYNSWSRHDFDIELDSYKPELNCSSTTATYNTTTNSLNMSWSTGNHTTSYVIVRRNDTYVSIADDSNGYIVYNSTNLFWNDTAVFTTRYYTMFGWNHTGCYSDPCYIIWGALGVSVFNESNHSQAITDWNIQLTNIVTEEVYIATSQNNILWLDSQLVPNGEDISVRIWADDYYERDYVLDLLNNQLVNESFFLPALFLEPEDEPGGGTGAEPNETFSPKLYYIYVTDDFDRPVQDAKVDIRRNIDGSFFSVGSFLTDSNGYGNIQLIPSVEYKITISKDLYITTNALWRPDPVYYGIYYPKPFKLLKESEEEETTYVFWDYITFTGEMVDNNTITITFTDSLSLTDNTQIYLYDSYNDTDTLIHSDSRTGENYFVINIVGINTTRLHYVLLFFNHSYIFDIIQPVKIFIQPITYISPTDEGIPHINATSLEAKLTEALGNNPLGWGNSIAVGLAIIFLVSFGPLNTGVAIMSSGSALFIVKLAFGLNNPILFGVIPVIIILGIAYIYAKGAEVHV